MWESINSIAVLPLDIQSNDPHAAYMSDGIAESISNRLARLSDLTVIPNSVGVGARLRGSLVSVGGLSQH
jgi:TolB-like protein